MSIPDKEHIEFIAGRGCYSQVGRSGRFRKQEIFLRPECAQGGNHLILHEVSKLYQHETRKNGQPRAAGWGLCRMDAGRPQVTLSAVKSLASPGPFEKFTKN